MKKWILALVALSALAVLSLYLWLPASQTPQLQLRLQANQQALLRRLVQQSLQQQSDSSKLTTHPGLFDGIILSVPYTGGRHNSMLQLTPLGTDSTLVRWNGLLQGSSTPWGRWQTYQRTRQITAAVKDFMATLHGWEQPGKLYGIHIRKEKVRDTTLMAIRFTTATYPATGEIYQHVEQLRQYIATQGATVTNHPMLHVRPQAGGLAVMVGLPASRDLNNAGAIEHKRMVMGNILVAEVRGGDHTVRQGMRQLEDYVSDHGLVSPAIPFVSLVTDRRQQPDTSRWISRLYYPIF